MSRNGNKISKNLIYVVAFILITLISLGYKLVLSGTFDGLLSSKSEEGPVTIRSEEETEPAGSSATEEPAMSSCSQASVSVYICGEVNEPGVYEIASGSIINDVVMMAGGFTDRAAEENINLVYIIDFNLSIYIPGEDEDYESNNIIRDDGQTVWGAAVDNNPGTEGNSLININTASADQLMTLPGIGEVTANAIVEYRQTNTFSRIEDIMNVSGIGEAKFNSIRDLICV